MSSEPVRPLADKVAIVTGAGKNIGRCIALALAADGASVVVNGRSNKASVESVAGEISEAGGKALPFLADVSQEAAVAAMIAAATETFGGVDIAVSNAALRRQTPFLKMSFAEWREIVAVSLDGAFLLARHALPSMVARGGGAFIGISGVSHHIGFRDRAHVNAAKSGLEGLVRGLAREFAEHKISVNAIAPGVVSHAGTTYPSDLGIPMGRPAHEEEIANMVRFLVNPQNNYVTGQTIHVNGGWHLGG